MEATARERMVGFAKPIASTAVIGDLGRTEDVRFSPSGRLLALANTLGSILVFEVDIGSRPVRIGRRTELFSSGLSQPHGVDFLAEDVIAVANRSAQVAFFRLPPAGSWDLRTEAEPIGGMNCDWFGRTGSTRPSNGRRVVCGPGSIRARGGVLYVCCNNLNTVSAHPYRLAGDEVSVEAGTIVAQEGLEIPDGIALSRDGSWAAVSNHERRCVFVYRCTDWALRGVLSDPSLGIPHGLSFDRTGHRLYVTDAGGRRMHVFAAARDWSSVHESSAFRLMAVGQLAYDQTMAEVKPQYRHLEGGLKGIDLDPAGRVLATTCRRQTLRFFQI